MKESQFKRSRLELYYYILKSCIINENHTRSSLNRQLLIPYSLLDECLIYLEQLGFIGINYNDMTLKTTLKGQSYVQKFGYLMQQVDSTSNMST
ncbi:MAG: winged helix-turn-helix domain-containing protein [Candidatus Nitrosocosmicus sp.]|nr:winged helix-turn-helix domain-containing protein [Candidatus Nitrosocosmicus sp.]